MCTADFARSVFLNPSQPASAAAETHTRSSAVRFAMKLPRCNNAIAKSLRTDSASQRAEETTPRVANGASVRRSQSANATRPRPRGIAAGIARSQTTQCAHPQGQGRQFPQRTQELPIPPSQHGRRESDLFRSADEKDLTRMYDCATWNMYERIVGARRQRLQAASLNSQQSTTGVQGSGAKKVATLAARTQPQQPLFKTSSQGDESTAGTVDETDKSSTTSSSWSRTDSPMAFPGRQQHAFIHGARGGPNGLAFSHLDPRAGSYGVHSCPPPLDHNDLNDEETFIFQLDM